MELIERSKGIEEIKFTNDRDPYHRSYSITQKWISQSKGKIVQAQKFDDNQRFGAHETSCNKNVFFCKFLELCSSNLVSFGLAANNIGTTFSFKKKRNKDLELERSLYIDFLIIVF